jgi:hypothetical protein
MTLARPFLDWLAGLPAERCAALADRYARALERDGLTVYRAAEDRFVPIAPALSPEPIADAELAALAADAELLLSATARACRWTLGDEPRARASAAVLYAYLTPLEHACLRRDPDRLFRVATARVDYFRGPDGVARALELNATIPAMQGYSDLVAHRFLEEVARERGLDPAPLLAAAGSNTADLLASLLAQHRRLGGRGAPPAIVIVSRRGDSQLGELNHYVRAFTAAGHRTRHVWVDELGLDVDGVVTARGERFDLVYRHIFARRVEEGSVMARLLLDPGPNVLLNPVLAPLEVKGVLGLLHEDQSAPFLPLSDDERAAVARRVPWTRVLRADSGRAPDGPVADLAAWVAAHPERVVVKRSWDYGGKGVLIGPDADGDAARQRMAEIYPGCTGWADFVGRAAADDNVWVAQELVAPTAARHLLVLRDAAGAPIAEWHDVFVDVNAYACLGVEARPRGGVCRASSSKIVNIAGGGGVAPLVTASVLKMIGA